jgi:hypothetical protein
VAENLCLLEYQQQEEPMLVIQALSHVVRDGASIANHIELAQVAAADNEPIKGKVAVVSEVSSPSLMRADNRNSSSLLSGSPMPAWSSALRCWPRTSCWRCTV